MLFGRRSRPFGHSGQPPEGLMEDDRSPMLTRRRAKSGCCQPLQQTCYALFSALAVTMCAPNVVEHAYKVVPETPLNGTDKGTHWYFGYSFMSDNAEEETREELHNEKQL